MSCRHFPYGPVSSHTQAVITLLSAGTICGGSVTELTFTMLNTETKRKATQPAGGSLPRPASMRRMVENIYIGVFNLYPCGLAPLAAPAATNARHC
jgi:hypothetical protein